MTTRKTAAPDAFFDEWTRLSPLTARQRSQQAEDYRLIELRQQAEFDALEPMNEFLDAFQQHNLDN